MRKSYTFLAAAIAVASLAVGCTGPEQKLSRGIRNATEFARLGEFRRTVEQTGIWETPNRARTYGVIHGFNRSVARTAIGVWEVATFPFPTKADGSYDAILTPTSPIYPDITIKNYTSPWGGMVLTEDPIYPESYAPGLPSNSVWDDDTYIGFSTGDAAPMIPGSRFSVFGAK